MKTLLKIAFVLALLYVLVVLGLAFVPTLMS